MGKVIVVGSLNMDVVLSTDRMPQVGETFIGKSVHYFLGGKGANQAVASSRMSQPTTLVGRVGQDSFGQTILNQLKKEALDSQFVEAIDTPTGMATIMKLAEDNAIVVVPGANERLSLEALPNDLFQSGDLLLLQAEIPMETIEQALLRAKEKGLSTVLNPAPYQASLKVFLPYVDYLTPNETEFAQLIGQDSLSDEWLEIEMKRWQEAHQTRLIVTRGAKGVSYLSETNEVRTIAARKIAVVDTTGAGDTFNGIFAARLARGDLFETAVEWATIGATLAVSTLGAQEGMPTKEEVQKFF